MAETKRKLAAILSADVAGYSRLMGADEEATIAALDARRAIFRDRVAARGGRVVDTTGDSVLCVFESVVEAVRCAAEVQAALAAINADEPEDRRMRFRIGVNLGDIVEKDDGTVYGDGVNVAARLEALAEPGGICLSGSAHEQVRDKTDFTFHDIGEHDVKNIARPVRAYRVLADGAPQAAPRAPQSRRTAVIVAAAVVVLAVAGVAVWQATKPTPTPPTEAVAKPVDPILALPARPVIAVLPFTNMSGDPEQEYFSDGITEDIITELSRFPDLAVIARHSTFKYKGEAIDLRHMAAELGATHVVEGRVRRSSNTIRVTAQLIDASDGTHMWADTYDRDLTAPNIFALQDDITSRIATTIGDTYGIISMSALSSAKRKAPDNLGAYECVLRGYEFLL